MTEDTEGSERTNRSTRSQVQSDDEEWTRHQWESLPGNPDEYADLDYELAEWEQFETLDGTDQVMFLPEDESELKDAAFVVAESDLHLDLANHC